MHVSVCVLLCTASFMLHGLMQPWTRSPLPLCWGKKSIPHAIASCMAAGKFLQSASGWDHPSRVVLSSKVHDSNMALVPEKPCCPCGICTPARR